MNFLDRAIAESKPKITFEECTECHGRGYDDSAAPCRVCNHKRGIYKPGMRWADKWGKIYADAIELKKSIETVKNMTDRDEQMYKDMFQNDYARLEPYLMRVNNLRSRKRKEFKAKMKELSELSGIKP